ncbi:TPA: tyrosine-type recombinase/integrase [Pasteurella multocida]|nr:tyrosine-type recombinase/integrase [Pasteurella multocida]
MLTDSKIKKLQASDKLYKVSDLHGLYVAVLPSGAKSFRYDYRFQGKRKTVTFGKYGKDGITLADAREQLAEARRLLVQGVCPALHKNKQKTVGGVCTFEQVFLRRLTLNGVSHSSARVLKSTYYTHIHPTLKDIPIDALSTDNIRSVFGKIDPRYKSVHANVHSVISSTFNTAVEQGLISMSPLRGIRVPANKTIKPRERYMTPYEISRYIGYINVHKTGVGLCLKILLYTLVRKMELAKAEWKDVDLENGIWFIPAANTKKRRDHVVYLSTQVIDMFRELRANSIYGKYVAESAYSTTGHISASAFNFSHNKIASILGIENSTVHDSRRTASTHLNELGYNADWIEKSLAHNKQNVRSVYNRAKYAKHRRRMLQEWADTIDRWVSGDFSDVEDLY